MMNPAPDGSRRRARLLVVAVFLLLLGGWAIGIWATMVRGTVQEVTGTFIARPSDATILVRHDAIPVLGMQPMELMSIDVESPDLIDRAALQSGDRVRLVVRQRPGRLLAVGLEKG